MKILIIDDEPDILELMSQEFRYRGHSVETASSGNEAVEILTRNFFDVVLSDFKMPNGNGITVLNFVNTLHPRPQFYFASGQADMSVDECLKKGALDFFHKPFDLDHLVLKIEKSLPKIGLLEI